MLYYNIEDFMSNTRCGNHENCISTTINQVEKICAENGLRFTKIRKAVLEIIWESHRPIKAYDILTKISNINYSEKPPTVYRALDFLMENGFVHKINSLNSYVGCSHPNEHSDCYFIICSICNEVQECCDSTITKTIKKILNKNTFKHDYIALEVNGQCNYCSDVSDK